jgi:hypothetical protein
MVIPLPAELILEIFAMATNDDLQTTSRLCLLNKSMQLRYTPLLYQHVCLTGTKQVKQFNATLKRRSPQVKRFIRGITLLEDLADATSLEEEDGWEKIWGALIDNLGI